VQPEREQRGDEREHRRDDPAERERPAPPAPRSVAERRPPGYAPRFWRWRSIADRTPASARQMPRAPSAATPGGS